MKNIINKNTIGEYHGYQEWYFGFKIYLRGYIKKGEQIGYQEKHGHTKKTNFLIK
jgi:hypothetical protein